MTNWPKIVFFIVKILIHLILSSTWNHVQKIKLSNHVLTVNVVSSDANLDKILNLI